MPYPRNGIISPGYITPEPPYSPCWHPSHHPQPPPSFVHRLLRQAMQFLTLTPTPAPSRPSPLPATCYTPPRKQCNCDPIYYTVCSPYFILGSCDNCQGTLWRKNGGHQWVHYECDNGRCRGKICARCREIKLRMKETNELLMSEAEPESGMASLRTRSSGSESIGGNGSKEMLVVRGHVMSEEEKLERSGGGGYRIV
ncbi:hypothetical protein BJ508DRAFT_377379 [Ascobolus immersus RN42]|uniref:Zinc-binding domain-containing protein n=1 Tax=Ascobolus immersus RN42 TaxID=1160509 RepID=A0A3N4I3H0_ASCIM|nr:hypothetical protein BJ508DRAFT_377379 [Ascobolus immersus RN42]